MSLKIQEVTHLVVLDDEEDTKFEVKGFEDGSISVTSYMTSVEDVEAAILCMTKFKERFF